MFNNAAATGSCLIKQDSASVVGTPTTDGDSETTYGCVASDNCNYEVHVIGNYESSNGRHGFFTERVAGDTDVIVSVSGESPRPLILVLTSYEPVRWRLSVTSAVIIDRVILVIKKSRCYSELSTEPMFGDSSFRVDTMPVLSLQAPVMLLDKLRH